MKNNKIYLNIWETLEERISRLIKMRRETNDEQFEDEINEELTRLYELKYGEEK